MSAKNNLATVPNNRKPEKARNTSIKISPRNDHQAEYVDLINSSYITICLGPAGCGKTFLACLQAMKSFTEYEFSKIVLIRPAVMAGEDIGFLPGTLEEKMDPYMAPLFDAFNEHWQTEAVRAMIETGEIEIVPLAFMRGRTFRNAFIIVDEAQNITKEQMTMLLTRFGDNCRMVVAGDASQSDLPYNDVTGLSMALRLCDYGVTGMNSYQFSKEDVVRHPVVKDILNAMEAIAGTTKR